jgi:hypothetical protein
MLERSQRKQAGIKPGLFYWKIVYKFLHLQREAVHGNYDKIKPEFCTSRRLSYARHLMVKS